MARACGHRAHRGGSILPGATNAELVARAARDRGLTLPVAEAIAGQFARAAEEHGDDDISAAYPASAAPRR